MFFYSNISDINPSQDTVNHDSHVDWWDRENSRELHVKPKKVIHFLEEVETIKFISERESDSDSAEDEESDW